MSVLSPIVAQQIGGMCMPAVPVGSGRQSSSLWHHAVLVAGLLAVCIVAVTQLPPLHETAGVLSEAVSRNRLPCCHTCRIYISHCHLNEAELQADLKVLSR